jgi:transposase-like protein
MNTYKRHRFPSDIISYAVWLYYRFNLSHRDIEDLLAQRGITVSRESIRLWCIKFGALYTRRLKRRHGGMELQLNGSSDDCYEATGQNPGKSLRVNYAVIR